MREPSLRYIIAAVAAATAVYLAMIILSDASEFVAASSGFNWYYLGPVIVLVTANYMLRAERWHVYLNAVGLGIVRRRSYWMFFAGLSMSVTPAKVGEAVKGVLLKIEKKAPVERGVGIVFVERMTDVIGVLVLIAIGALALPYGLISVFLLMVVVTAIVIVVTSESLSNRIIGWLRGHGRLRKMGDTLQQPLQDARILLRGTNLLKGSAMSVIAWACEGAAFYLILTGLSQDISVLQALFIYSFSSVVGAVSMLPGGMGTTEGTMVALLLLEGTTSAVSSFAVIITRVFTLWYAVAVGTIFLAMFKSSRAQEERNDAPIG